MRKTWGNEELRINPNNYRHRYPIPKYKRIGAILSLAIGWTDKQCWFSPGFKLHFLICFRILLISFPLYTKIYHKYVLVLYSPNLEGTELGIIFFLSLGWRKKKKREKIPKFKTKFINIEYMVTSSSPLKPTYPRQNLASIMVHMLVGCCVSSWD